MVTKSETVVGLFIFAFLLNDNVLLPGVTGTMHDWPHY